MNTTKLSISIPYALALFISEYQKIHAYRTKSEVLQEAIKLLRQKELESEYMEANNEIDSSFDVTSGDGLDDETW